MVLDFAGRLAVIHSRLFKAEVIWRKGPWHSMEAVELAPLEWVDWFNTRRLLEQIGNTWRNWRSPPDPNETASGEVGAVQFDADHFVGAGYGVPPPPG
jgi:hypothetical protein